MGQEKSPEYPKYFNPQVDNPGDILSMGEKNYYEQQMGRVGLGEPVWVVRKFTASGRVLDLVDPGLGIRGSVSYAYGEPGIDVSLPNQSTRRYATFESGVTYVEQNYDLEQTQQD